MRLKKNHLNYFFHPYEISLCGFSNTGRTTLVSKVVTNLSKDHRVGYLKHDAHDFSIDSLGKETAILREAGATDTLINDKDYHTYISNKSLEQVEIVTLMQDNDVLIIEGYKYSPVPKIIFLGTGEHKEKIISEIKTGEIRNIVAIITADENEENPFPEYPSIYLDDSKKITFFIETYFKELIPKKVYGLVLTGGKSQRMNKDKGALKYFAKDQVSHTVDLLEPFCDNVFVSCRKEQEESAFVVNHNQLHDNFPSVGPSSGILTAMNQFPAASWVIVACDLPYLTNETITHLFNNRNPFKNATCFLNPTKGWPEPLCTIYEPKVYNKIIQYFGMGKPCPRKVLFNSEITALELFNKNDLDNVNTPDEFHKAKDYIQQNGERYES